MTTFAKISAAALIAGFALVPSAAPLMAGSPTSTKVEPYHGVTLKVGSKTAVGYFANNEKACNLTLMLADAYADRQAPSEAVRVNLTVRAGNSANVETFESDALSFACAADATSMTIQPIKRVAYNAAAK